MNASKLYSLIYALAASDGREKVLFGHSAPYAQEAFERGLVDDIFPELWFELPLLGEPWFDLHMLVARSDMHEDVRFAGLEGPYADTLSWFAQSAHTRKLALSFDAGVGNASEPAVQLLLNEKSMSAAQGFLSAAGHPDAIGSYRAFMATMPQAWYNCYVGLFPARADADWIRVECLLNRDTQQAYAQDADLLCADLAQVGMRSASKVLVNQIQRLAASAFPLEFQFNVGADGRVQPTMSASLRFQPAHWRTSPELIASEFEQAREWGLADERCELLSKTVFAVKAKRNGQSRTLWCFPAFLKLRWVDGQPKDAKTYLMAGIL